MGRATDSYFIDLLSLGKGYMQVISSSVQETR